MTPAPDINHHPLALSNTLRLPGETSMGMYLHLVDSIIQTNDEVDIFYHEVAHRIFFYGGMEASSFHIIQNLAGLSHTLIWEITRIINEHEIHLQGNNIKNLTIHNKKNNNEINARLGQLIHYVNYIEEHIEMAWRGLEPFAEFSAIDFAYTVTQNRRGGSLWRKKDSSNPDEESEKEKIIDYLLEKYPSNFGGYNINYGSYQNAIKTAWREYKSVDNEKMQRELLRLSMNTLYMEPKEERVYIGDPIYLILQNVSIARKGDDKAFNDLFKKRELLAYKASFFLAWLEQRILLGLSDEALHYKKYPELLHMLVLSQLSQDSQKRFMTPVVWGQGSIDSQLSSEVGFLNFKYKTNQGEIVLINPAFLINANLKKTKPASEEEKEFFHDITIDWWKELIFLESFRQAIKTGSKWQCPFYGFQILSSAPTLSGVFQDEIGLIECSSNCIVKKMEHEARGWVDVFDSISSCHI